MMKFMFMMMMMIPLTLLKNYFWVNQLFLFLLSFMYMFYINSDYSILYIYSNFGWDMMSYVLVLLSMWICSLMILASYKINKEKFYSEFFCFTVLMLLMALFFAFSSLSFFIFYLFFEISLIPTLILILGWGYQPERLQAGVYLFFYTLLASLPMLIAIFFFK